MALRVDVFCTLPEILTSPLEAGVLKRAAEAGALDVRVHDLHRLSPEPHGKVDDAPYGGGPGMVLRVDVVAHALEQVFGFDAFELKDRLPVILLTPQGERFGQKAAGELAGEEELVLICGRYEGVDERVRERIAGMELSIGDYVLSGGEAAVVVVLEAVARLLPSVLGNRESVLQESFSEQLLEYPQYTRPASYKGVEVPEILRGGNHRQIEEWRRRQALERTRKRRPDLLSG